MTSTRPCVRRMPSSPKSERAQVGTLKPPVPMSEVMTPTWMDSKARPSMAPSPSKSPVASAFMSVGRPAASETCSSVMEFELSIRKRRSSSSVGGGGRRRRGGGGPASSPGMGGRPESSMGPGPASSRGPARRES
ncbi:MAG: hypothetical protein M5U28_40330 [Sandaracinaceae bacterium]|nr:hypothetical protein [Sandaracinaceae bacterium]